MDAFIPDVHTLDGSGDEHVRIVQHPVDTNMQLPPTGNPGHSVTVKYTYT